MNADAIRSWLTARFDDDAQEADGFHDYAWCAKSLYDDPCDCKYPDRIRREVAAKRRRLQRHAPSALGKLVYCGQCSDGQPVPTEWPCPDVIDDAQAWADRDDLPAELRLP